jgi:hypothetical protein
MICLSALVFCAAFSAGETAAQESADNPMMTPPPPLTDSTLLNWLGGAWGGDLTMGDQKMYGEAQFSLGVGQQWLVGKFGVYTDKSKATALPMEFLLYIRPGANAGSYKGVQVIGDGSWAMATGTKSGDDINFIWTYDNGMKENGTLSKKGPDHVVYSASVTDAAGNKVMDFQHDMHRTKTK